MVAESRFSLENTVLLAGLTGLYAFVIGWVVIAVSPGAGWDIPLAWQHLYEVASILVAGALGVATFESVRGKDVYDDQEMWLFLGLFSLATLFLQPLLPGRFIPDAFVGPAARLAVVAVFQSVVAIGIAVVLERYTEVI